MKNLLMFSCVILLISLASFAQNSNEVFVYVSPEGNDTWSGTLPQANENKTDGPLATIQKALEKVKDIRSSGAVEKTVRVVLRGGTYFISTPIVIKPEHSGKKDAPTIFENYNNEKPLISGGVKITSWKKEDNRYVADIQLQNIGELVFNSLWVNGERRQPARIPDCTNPFGDYPSKQEFFTAKKYEYVPESEEQPGTLKVFYDEKDPIQNWETLKGSYCVLFCKWAVPLLPIRSVDTNEKCVYLNVPKNFWFGVIFSEGQRFYIEHLLEGLDKPGEWYLDREKGKLYYIPLPEEDMTSAEVIVPVVEQLLLFEGIPTENKFVEHIVFKGIEFAFTDFRIGERGQADPQAEVSVPGAIQGTGAQYCFFEKCTIQHVSNYALWWRSGSQNNTIRQCHLYDMG
ncbi:MAG: hypothetical protein ACP5KS_13960, partial [Candidatus Hydrogenedens sp.]